MPRATAHHLVVRDACFPVQLFKVSQLGSRVYLHLPSALSRLNTSMRRERTVLKYVTARIGFPPPSSSGSSSSPSASLALRVSVGGARRRTVVKVHFV